MSPASYLAAPPRVAARRIAARKRPTEGLEGVATIAAVPWWTWLALGVFVAGAGGGLAVLAAATWRAYRRGLATLRQGEGAAADLLARLAELERRVDRAAETSAELEVRLAGLRRSLARLSVLVGAVADVRTSVRRVAPRR
jgi:hypothetical protein